MTDGKSGEDETGEMTSLSTNDSQNEIDKIVADEMSREVDSKDEVMHSKNAISNFQGPQTVETTHTQRLHTQR